MLTSNNGQKQRICVVLVDRANYGRLKPVLHEITERPANRTAARSCRHHGSRTFHRPGSERARMTDLTSMCEIYIELEGSTPATMAKSLGFAVSRIFQ